MSHFSVLVIGDDWEGQLAPYDESIQVDEYPDECYCYTEDTGADKSCDSCQGTGTRMSTYNPNSKWNLYSMGGRWKGSFKLKKDKKGVSGESGVFDNKDIFDCDQAFKGDIDFEEMLHLNHIHYAEYWDKIQLKLAEGPINPAELYFIHGIKKDDPALHDKELYIAQRAGFSTYAVVKDGKWYERGKMGWWGMASNEKEKEDWDKECRKLLSDLPDDTMLTVVDCHI